MVGPAAHFRVVCVSRGQLPVDGPPEDRSTTKHAKDAKGTRRDLPTLRQRVIQTEVPIVDFLEVLRLRGREGTLF